METVHRNWRAAVVLGGGVALFLLGLGLASLDPPSPPPERQQTALQGVDLGRLYTVDHLVLEGDPILKLDWTGPVGAGPPGSEPVPEPPAGMLWILGLTALYALYLPARSW